MAWDIDDVLNELMRNWLEQEWLYRNPASVLTYQQLLSNPPHQICRVSLSNTRPHLTSFAKTGIWSCRRAPKSAPGFSSTGPDSAMLRLLRRQDDLPRRQRSGFFAILGTGSEHFISFLRKGQQT